MRMDIERLRAVVAHHLGPRVRLAGAERMTGGTFNSVYRLDLEGYREREAVLKVAPARGTPLMTYESGLIRAEAEFYDRAAAVPGTPVPRVLAVGLDGRVIDADHLLMTRLPGRPWAETGALLDPDDRTRLRTDLGRLVGRLHGVRGTRFGYPRMLGSPASATWRSAFGAMLADVCADAVRYGADLPYDPAEIRRLVAGRAWLLDEVTSPALVHYDLWEGNILLAERAGRPEISGLIDGERSFWGDPLADLVSPALFDDISRDAPFVTTYRATTSAPPRLTDHELWRIALYRLYLSLIMLTEGAPRGYDPEEHAPLAARARTELHTAVTRLEKAPAAAA